MDGLTEWLEPDGLGGFASGTVSGRRTRRYHGLLLIAATPPTGRVMLVNGVETEVRTPDGRFALSSQYYAPGVEHPDGAGRVRSFSFEPWPTWTYELEDGPRIEHEVFSVHGTPLTALRWRAVRAGRRRPVTLSVRPLLSGRDYHAAHRENGVFRFDAIVSGGDVTWRPYDGLPAVSALTNGRFEPAPDWYRQFLYEEERTRGLDCLEDLASPGAFAFDLSSPAIVLLTTAPEAVPGPAADAFERLAERERARRVFLSPLHRAADAYLVARGAGRTVVAGYPWFTDWGRDTFIALRGLCIATGRLHDAKEILLAWAPAVSRGMLPNRFPDRGDAPEYNAVDASLWFIVAVHALFEAAADGDAVSAGERSTLRAAVDAILEGYAAGTRFGIRADSDGLLACGEPGVQLTWMDAKIGDWVVTPRCGKPVEVQALWINALWIAGRWSTRWAALLHAAHDAFRTRFWNDVEGCLFDVVDVDHRPGTEDGSIRPNQILAAGGLPLMLLDRDAASRMLDVVEAKLLTPFGLRSLAPGSPGYSPRYEGSPAQRDARYHQGTVWPWLIGPFVEAWLRVRGSTPQARAEARGRFLQPLLDLARRNGGHLPEIVDADPPHAPRGCPWQAWSVAEAVRLELSVLAGSAEGGAQPFRFDAFARDTAAARS